jgi:serine/threonine protein kinase
VTASSGHAPETLWEYDELVLSRDVWNGEGFPLLAVIPSSAQTSPETLARLQHAHALREELDPAWAARPLRLEPHHGRLTLLNEDPGGEPLLRLLRRPWEITSFLRLAIGAVMRLAQLHQRGLIHKDIKPANILATSAGAWRSRSRPEVMPRPNKPDLAGHGLRGHSEIDRPVHPAPLFEGQCRRASRQSLPAAVTISSATRPMATLFQAQLASSLWAAPYLTVMSKRDWSRER